MSTTYEKLGQYNSDELPVVASNLTMVDTGEDYVIIGWENNALSEDFPTAKNQIQQIVNGLWTVVKDDLALNDTQETIEGLDDNTEYRFRVVVVYGGYQFPSEILVATTTEAVCDTCPQELQLVSTSSTSTKSDVTFSWTLPTNISGLEEIHVIRDDSEAYVFGIDATSGTCTNINSGEHNFKVASWDGDNNYYGQNPASIDVTITAAMTSLSNLAYDGYNAPNYEFSWTVNGSNPSGADGGLEIWLNDAILAATLSPDVTSWSVDKDTYTGTKNIVVWYVIDGGYLLATNGLDFNFDTE